jgi:hypothetical protein
MNAQTIPQSESKACAMLRRDVEPKLRRIAASTCHVEAFGEDGLVTPKPLAKSEAEGEDG